MAWETESKSKMTGTVDTDATIGGGSQNYSGDAETLAIEARGETWYVGVQNESDASSSDFFIGLSSSEATDNLVHIQNDGAVGIGTGTSITADMKLDVSGTINCSGLIVNGTNFSALSSGTEWTESGGAISYAAGTVTIGGAYASFSAARDFKVFGSGGSNHLLVDASANLMTMTNIGLTLTGGNVVIGTDGTGTNDVTFYSDIANSKFLWDGDGNLSGESLTDTANNEPSLSLGSNGGSEGADFVVFGHTNNKYMWWDCSADQLKITGGIDVADTTNLDAVDIDGAVQVDGAITVGVNDTGYDVKFFGAASGKYLLWDESADSLLHVSATGTATFNGDKVVLNSGVTNHFGTTGSVLGLRTSTSTTFLVHVDGTGTTCSDGYFNIGTASDTDNDFKVFGSGGSYMLFDTSEPELLLNACDFDCDLADHAFDIDTTTGAISLTTTTGNLVMESSGASGTLTIQNASTVANSIKINASGSNSSTTFVIASSGTGLTALDIDSAGGIDIDGAGDIAIDTSDTTDGVKIGAGTSGMPVTLGHTTSEVIIGDNLKVNGFLKTHQTGQATSDDGTTAVGHADISRGIVQCTPTADRSKATDTAANLISNLALTGNGDSFDWSFINLATDGSSHVTLTAGSDVTLVGCMVISAQDVAEDAFTSGVAMFRIRRTASDAVTMYRIA